MAMFVELFRRHVTMMTMPCTWHVQLKLCVEKILTESLNMTGLSSKHVNMMLYYPH